MNWRIYLLLNGMSVWLCFITWKDFLGESSHISRPCTSIHLKELKKATRDLPWLSQVRFDMDNCIQIRSVTSWPRLLTFVVYYYLCSSKQVNRGRLHWLLLLKLCSSLFKLCNSDCISLRICSSNWEYRCWYNFIIGRPFTWASAPQTCIMLILLKLFSVV